MAEGFRANAAFSSMDSLVDLGIGEALVGGLEDKGTPAMVQRVAVAPPRSRVGPLDENERRALIADSPLRTRYDKAVDCESRLRNLLQRAKQSTKAEPQENAAAPKTDQAMRSDLAGRVFKSAMRLASSQSGRQLARRLLGSLLRVKR